MLIARMELADGPRDGIATSDYERLRIQLSRAVARVCPRMLSDRREDLVQDCVLRVMDLTKKSEGERVLSPSYLYKVAYSALIDEIRRIRRRREAPLEEGDRVPAEAAHGDPEAVAAGQEIGRGVLDCLAGLNRDRRLSVTLYLQGHSVVEAAAILEWPAKKTQNLVYRALADLRGCLASKGIRP
jgi:RNA polymerase sigma-70 factor (ECF subfamily)